MSNPSSADEQLPADPLAPFVCPRHDCESTRHALNQSRVENKHLREDLARYENGRVVMTAEIEAMRRERDQYKLAAEMNAETIRNMQRERS